MPYCLRTITKGGAFARNATPAKTIKVAMLTACASLRYGAKDAWIEDAKGKKVAEFEEIKKFCAEAGGSN